jgi:hypothetical protein
VLVLVKQGGRLRSTVFVQPPDARYQLYVGIPADSATVARETGLARRDMRRCARRSTRWRARGCRCTRCATSPRATRRGATR